jgi:hypothetical protein
VTKHQGKYCTKSEKKRKRFSEIDRKRRQTYGPPIVWDADSGDIGQDPNRAKYIPRRVLGGQVHILGKEELFSPSNLSLLTV